MTGTPVWFGPTERPLFGMLHVPADGRARAGVVVCPPLGREDQFAHSTLRETAERLAQAGIAVLRFDYDGTGDSAGDQDDPERVAAWSASTRIAVDVVRAAGAPVTGIVGMRMGAVFAAHEAQRRPLDLLVLWDPCASGRAFLREQWALQALAMTTPAPADGAVYTPGFRYGPETVRDLRPLALASTTGPLARRLCVVTRPERGLDAGLSARLEELGDVQYQEASGLDELLDPDGQLVSVPGATVDRVVSWMSSVVPSRATPFNAAAFDRTDVPAVVARHGGRRVVERPVRVGEAGVFGIVTEAEGDDAALTVLCLNMGRSRRIGPSRMWVELARRWAGYGLRTVRFDLSGLGDSGNRPGQTRDVIYPDEALQDIDTVARWVSPEDPSAVVVLGVCSGAFHAARSGAALGARGACLVNPPPLPGPVTPRAGYTTPHPRRIPTIPLRRWLLDASGRPRPQAMLARLPDSAWWVMNRFGLRYSTGADLVHLVNAGPEVLVVGGAVEIARMRRGTGRALRRLGRSGRFRMEILEDLNHALLGPGDGARVGEVLDAHVRARFCAPERVRSGQGVGEQRTDQRRRRPGGEVAVVASSPPRSA